MVSKKMTTPAQHPRYSEIRPLYDTALDMYCMQHFKPGDDPDEMEKQICRETRDPILRNADRFLQYTTEDDRISAIMTEIECILTDSLGQ